MKNSPERHLGFFNPDNPDGNWFQSEDKDSFVRFYDTGFRETIHRREIMVDVGYGREEPQMKWVVSLGMEDSKAFAVGHTGFDTVKEAKEWADDRDDESYMLLEFESQRILNQKYPKKDEPMEDNGF